MDAKAQTQSEQNLGPIYPPAQPAYYYPPPQQPSAYPIATQHPYYPEQQYPQHPEQPEQPAGGCCKNSPQFLSVGAGAYIIYTGGMSMAWGTGFNGLSKVNDSDYMNVCWFAMVIVGAFLSAILTSTLQKKVLMLMSSILVMIGGVLFITLYDNYAAIMAARHINGFAVGWILVTTFVMAGEEAAKEVRGTLVSLFEAVFFSFGIFIQIIYSATWTKNIHFDSNRFHGILVLCFGLIAFAAIIKQVIESPIYFLKKNQEQLALNSLLQLQQPCVMSAEKHAQLEEHKQYIASRPSAIAILSAVFKLCLLRGIIGLSFTTFVTNALQYAVSGAQFRYVTLWPLIVYGVCRFSGTLFGFSLQDTLGRKLPLIISMLICGGMAIGIGILFDDNRYDFFYKSRMQTAMVFLFVYQFFTGVCITSSSAYLTEAFPVTAKPYCIAFVLAIEMIMFIICGNIFIHYISIRKYFFALGGISFLFVVLTILSFPETKRTTLREALQKFEKFF